MFYSLVCCAGLICLVYGIASLTVDNLPKFACFLFFSLVASRLKVNLPEINGTVSVNFLFILIGIVDLNFGQTLVLGCASVIMQSFFGRNRWPKFEQLLFNVCSTAFAVWIAYFSFHALRSGMKVNSSLWLMIAACVYFLFNSLPVAAIISLTERKALATVWTNCYFWSFPYYLIGAAIAAMVSWVDQRMNWETSLFAFPAMFVIYRSYRLYLSKLENEKQHVEEMAGLHLRTIEALALAIEAKDKTTHDHLRRVRVYAIEIAKLLNLPSDQLEALRAASLLHDIGKLAVPEHILSKPGRLTREEFEKVKIHPIVGAEILERVEFPYPVVPIVRSHHEKWDGSGYPDGLKAEEIPMGARILSAVDCFDALASNRQYRSALPLDEVIKNISEEAGKSFDPRIVHLLEKHYIELEKMVHAQGEILDHKKLSTGLKVERGLAPAAGLEISRATESTNDATFLSSIAAAREEAQTLFELSHDLGNSLSLDETFSVLCVRLKRLVPCDMMAAYILRGNELVPEYVNGENLSLFSSLSMAMGQGLSGWVAQNRRSIVNGNPAQEPWYVDNIQRSRTLRSAISVPLEGLQGVTGVLTLYHADRDVFSGDHLRILMAISSKVALSVENALAFRQAENSATTDYLTGLPNSRSLFLYLERELAQCRRHGESLTVMVCDLNGFKQINDRFGHLEGNRVLRLFATSLQASCRENDCVARIGGDEFVVVAHGLALTAAAARGVLLSEIATAAGREVCGEDLLSLSVGCAVYPADGTDTETLLAEADRRMYSEKRLHHSRGKVLTMTAGQHGQGRAAR